MVPQLIPLILRESQAWILLSLLSSESCIHFILYLKHFKTLVAVGDIVCLLIGLQDIIGMLISFSCTKI